MVDIKLSLQTLEFQVDGHARAGEFGQDLICCAVSVLVQTLIRNMEVAYERGELQYLDEEVRDGHVYLMPHPYGWSLQNIVTAYRVIREGLRALSEQYEQYIRLEEE